MPYATSDSRTRYKFVFTLILLLVLSMFSSSTQAAPIEDTSRPPLPVDQILYDLPMLKANPDEYNVQPQVGSEITFGESAERLVFQSLRDGNWEIYIAYGDGSGQTRLTNHESIDIHPQINRGCTRIVFASKRSGSYEIYTMNIDGSALRRLTTTGADNVNPTWSRDGTMIAFESYRDGQAEIYTMNADGSNQVRLTVGGSYEGEPTWSPDGTKIAYVSNYPSGNYRIWVMNADGSTQTQLSNQAISENPSWSPDGTRIAYDADGDGNGWQELWVMNADGSDQRELHRTPEFTDIWCGSWSPDGEYIAFTRISFVYYEGNWYWTEAQLRSYDVVRNVLDVLVGEGTDWSPDWNTSDLYAPKSNLDPLPHHAHNPVILNWSGNDLGEAGIKVYDVQYQDTSTNTWVDWFSYSWPTSAPFSGQIGATYRFRLRAEDNSGNVEDWSGEDPNAYTTLYTWAVKGAVYDNTGTPVEGAIITTTPASFETSTGFSTEDNTYAAYVANEVDDYHVTIGKNGYGTLPPGDFKSPYDAFFDVYLPPVDDVVINGGFEDQEGSSSSWMFDGTILPTHTEGSGHTGQWGVVLGYDVLTDHVCVEPEQSTDPYGCAFTSIQAAIDAAESGQTVWVFPGVYTETLELKSGTKLRSIEGPAETIIDGNRNGVVISISYIENVLVEGFTIRNGNDYYDSGGIYIRGTEDSPVIIRNNWLINNHGALGGAMKILYASPQIIGNWFIGNSTSGTTGSIPNCIDGAYGAPLVANNVFWKNGGGDPCIDIDRSTNALIHNNTFVGNGAGIGAVYDLDTRNNIVVDSLGAGVYNDVTAFYYNDVWNNSPDYLDYAQNQTGYNGNISREPMFVNATVGDFRLYPQSPLQDAGDPDPSFNDPDGSRNDMGAWGGPYALSPNIMSSSNLEWTHAWFELTPWAEETVTMTLGLKDKSTGEVESKLSQVITLTESLINPTLSFLYQTREDYILSNEIASISSEDKDFVVIIESDTVSTTEYLVQSFEGDVWVYLDEVSIGSAYPDLWISTSSHPTAALPGEQIIYTINYANQGGVEANSVWITDTLPNELTLVDTNPTTHTPAPVLSWDVGTIPANSEPFSIVVTTTVASTATLRSTFTKTARIGTITPELNIYNNSYSLEGFVGRIMYMPIAMKEH